MEFPLCRPSPGTPLTEENNHDFTRSGDEMSTVGNYGTGQTRWEPIDKSPAERAAANLTDYRLACREFSWQAARLDLAGLPGGGVNIAYEAVDRHLDEPGAPAPSLRWLSAAGGCTTLGCEDLVALSNRFANVLRELGVRRGERVCTLLGRTPDLYVAALGAWKAGCVVSPLFAAFGPEPVRQRLALAGATTLVTTASFYERKVAPIRDELPLLRHVLVTDAGPSPAGGIELPAAMSAAESEFTIVRTISKIRRCCISPVARPGHRRARCTCTVRSSRIGPPPVMPWTCALATYSGVPPIPAG